MLLSMSEYPSQPNSNRDVSRHDFIQQGLAKLGENLFNPLNKANDAMRTQTFLRPPGAQPEALFLTLCTRCDACTAACPHETISVHYGSGFPNDGTPVLNNLQSHPCVLCDDTPCIESCPTEALLPVESLLDVRIGTAKIDNTTCTAYRGSGCSTCVDVCPYPDIAITLAEGLPVVLTDACTGCGICEHHCPTDPAAIKVFPLVGSTQH